MKFWALILIAIGVVIIFAGDSLANIGTSVDNLISSKWTGAALIAAGGIVFVGSESKFKIERSL